MLAILKLPFALQNDQLVHISKVSNGRRPDCLCPECKHPLIARKGRIKQHHFAHDPGSQCNLESALHWIGKTLIHDGIREALKDGRPITLIWQCTECCDIHEGNLLKHAATVKLEPDLGPARPDVLLVDAQDKPIAAIEVVVAHPLEDTTRSFYREMGIAVVEVSLKTYEASDALRDLAKLNATAVSLCTRPKCSCGKPLSRKTLHVVSGPCYRCKKPMKISFVDREGYVYGPREFSKCEIEIALKSGCLLKKRFSKTMRESYLANICEACGAFAGENYLYEFSELTNNTTGIVVGRFCHYCNKHVDR